MRRTVLGIVVGLVAWGLIVTVLNFGLRLGIPGYTQAEPALQFTLTMKIARLVMAALTSLAAGMLVGAVAPGKRWAPWIVGLFILVPFLLEHIRIWDKFPPWYHLSFLVPLVPLVVLGAAALGPHAQIPRMEMARGRSRSGS
jgi:hypothetical protein